jgi:phenylalanyl-tRNA synthetase alpha chain
LFDGGQLAWHLRCKADNIEHIKHIEHSSPTALQTTTMARPLSVLSHYKRSACRWLSTASKQSPPAVSTSINDYPLDDPDCNTPSSIVARLGAQLHRRPHHPLYILQQRIVKYWQNRNPKFVHFDNLSPVVSTHNNFDLLRIPTDHVSRSKSDTYYLNKHVLLRAHTSAHQVDLLKAGHSHFLVTGDVYRRDEIDKSHYPIFHQTEGVQIYTTNELQDLIGSSQVSHQDKIEYIQQDLQQGLQGLADHLFGPTDSRWIDAYFAFTHPSFELEIYFQESWLEVLGCGVVHPDIVTNAGLDPNEYQGWAFGLGLERLAMVLFGIPDIRLFWSEDPRFHQQFVKAGDDIVQFQPYSKYPPCYKDMSFWIKSDFHVNDLHEIVRSIAGDLVEEVALVDDFVHPKTQQTSHCYRITYRSMDRSLTNEEIDSLQEKVRKETETKLGVTLR